MTGMVRTGVPRRAPVALEEELLNLVGQTRNGHISARYFGLDGRGGTSLRLVGDQFGITRERVRQIVSVVADNVMGRRPQTPCLDQVISFALQKAPIRASECEDLLRDTGLTSGRFRLEGVLHAAELLGKSSPFFLDAEQDRTVLGPASLDAFYNVIRVAQKQIVSQGMTTVDRVIEILCRTDPARRYEAEFVERALACRDDLQWLDRKSGWFWLSKTGRNRVLNGARKILAITEPIELHHLLAGLARHYRMQGFSPPCSVLLEFCRQAPGLRVGNNLVSSERPIDPKDALSPVEQERLRIFSENGIMTRAEIAGRCAELRMNRLTIEQYLVYSPILSGYGGGRYGLVGREATAIIRTNARDLSR
jgi:hypothetical protein